MNTLLTAQELAKKYCDEETYSHVSIVVRLAKELAQKYSADEEAVEIACWLHDIGRHYEDNKKPRTKVQSIFVLS